MTNQKAILYGRFVLSRVIGIIGLFLFSGLLISCNSSNQKSGQQIRQKGPETIYVAMYGSRNTKLRGKNPVIGVFYSRDEGKTWHHTGWTQEHTFAVMAVPGGKGDTVFTACGNGVLRTTDGGKYWKIVTGWQMDEVQDVSINPKNPKQIFAVSPYGIFRSDDLGDTWKEMDQGLKAKFTSAVRFDHYHPQRVWAGTQKGLYYSDDSGAQWKATSITEPVRSIRQSMIDPSRWAIATTTKGVAVSNNDGKTWKFSSGPMDTTTTYRCEFDPFNSNILYAGGWKTGIMVSDNFGRSWHTSNNGLGNEPIHGIAVSRKVKGLIFVGSLGRGLFKSTDGGKNWQPVAQNIFRKGQIWDIYVEGEQ